MSPTRRILAIGGGSFLMEDEPSPVDALLLQLAGVPRPRVCFIGTPSGDLPEHLERFERAFPSSVCEPSTLSFFRKRGSLGVPLTDVEPALLRQHVVYVGGGNTKSALGVWRAWGLDRALAAAYEAGVLLCGMSAGAMCWFEAGMTDSSGEGYQPLPCLGLLHGGCAVHYGGDATRRERLHALVGAGELPAAVAIDDQSAVLYEDGQLSQVLRWGAGRGACQVSATPAGVVETWLAARALPAA